MTWSTLSLNTPISDAGGLTNNVSVFAVTPWTHGVREGSGNHTWLAFPNAVDAAINHVKNTSPAAVFAVGLAAANFKDLAGQIEQLQAVFPLKQLAQWQRHAARLVTLEIDKFDLVAPKIETKGMAINSVPTVKARMEKAISQAALSEAASISGQDPLSNLNGFEVAKSSYDAAVNSSLGSLSGGAGFRFYAEGDVAAQLKNGHPGHEYTTTALLVFSGSVADLAYLKELMP